MCLYLEGSAPVVTAPFPATTVRTEVRRLVVVVLPGAAMVAVVPAVAVVVVRVPVVVDGPLPRDVAGRRRTTPLGLGVRRGRQHGGRGAERKQDRDQ